MKKLSLKGLADYMTASPTRQRSILRSYKYPTEDEAQAKILYYREARDRIAAFHSSGETLAWLGNQATILLTLASYSRDRRRARLEHNARGIQQYARNFGSRSFDILGDFSHDLQYGDVVVSVYPDLHVREGETEKLIKLEFSKDEPNAALIRIISQCMFEAARDAGLGLSSANILLLDVPRGRAHRSSRMGARMARDIEATCENISAIWDTI
jgi:hypothetical protein